MTGDVQSGKSTVLQKVLARLNVSVGGFQTGFGSDRGEADRWLYLWDASGVPAPDQDHGVVHFTEGARPEVFSDRFNELGGGALRRARESGADLILMDECGRFEGQAGEFQREIFTALDGDVPVLGVVRQGYNGWLDEIRSHPNVTLITVTQENRDNLPDEIISMIETKK